MSTKLRSDPTKQVRLDAKLHKRVKILAAYEQAKVLDLINKFVEKGLENLEERPVPNGKKLKTII